ncbi:MAG: DUF6168 family protein [Fluviicola sp.]|jgi:hypothetical protein
MIWFIVIGLLMCLLHVFVIERFNINVHFGIYGIYLYNLIISIAITSTVFLLKNKLKESISWIFLSGVFLKIGIFAILYNGIIFKEKILTDNEKYSIVFPMLLFFGIEAFIVYKIILLSKEKK